MQSFERTGLGLFSVLFFTRNEQERAVEVYVHTHVYMFV